VWPKPWRPAWLVASKISSLPEIAGDAAPAVDPRRVAEVLAALPRALQSPNCAPDLVTTGGAAFSLTRRELCAAQHWTFLES